MAVDMFIKVGDIEGESTDDAHAGEIDVLAWSWGMTQSGSMHMGPGGGAGKVTIQDLSFTKYVDSSSPVLMLRCCDGKGIEECTLVVRKAGGTPVEYVKIVMTGCIIGSVSTGGSGGEDRITENVVLNFAKVNVTYTGQDNTGAATAEVVMGWDIEHNIEA